MKQPSKYDHFKRQELIKALHNRDKEIRALKEMTLDQHIRNAINTEINAASWAIRNGNR
jgi:hypothetical protein